MVKLLYKITAFFIIPNLLFNFPAIAKNQPANKKSVIEINKTDNQKQVEKFDFRKTKWGMSHQDVQNTENKEPITQENNTLVYQDYLLGINANVNYYFENGQLIKAAYFFEGTFTDQVEYIIYFKKIKNALLDKYGRPAFDNSKELEIMEKEMYKQVGELIFRGVQEYETKWDTPSTIIRLLLKGKELSKTKLELVYLSKQHKHLDDKTEVEKDKF